MFNGNAICCSPQTAKLFILTKNQKKKKRSRYGFDAENPLTVLPIGGTKIDKQINFNYLIRYAVLLSALYLAHSAQITLKLNMA